MSNEFIPEKWRCFLRDYEILQNLLISARRLQEARWSIHEISAADVLPTLFKLPVDNYTVFKNDIRAF